MFRAGILGCTLCALGLVVAILCVTFSKGYTTISWNFFSSPSSAGGMSGGIFYQIIGSLILVASAALIVTPIAIAIAVSATMIRKPRVQSLMRATLHVLNATPSILFGILGFLFFIKICQWERSWLSGGVILALMILPTVTLAMIHRMESMPSGYLETARSLGLDDNHLIRSIYIPYGYGGLLTGLVMGIARAAGETAPIMFIAVIFSGATVPTGIRDNPVLALPYHIFNLAQDVLGEGAQEAAWATAFTLISFVLFLSLLAVPFRSKSHEEAKIQC